MKKLLALLVVASFSSAAFAQPAVEAEATKAVETPRAELKNQLSTLLTALSDETKVATKKELKDLSAKPSFSETELLAIANTVLARTNNVENAAESASAEALRTFIASVIASLKEYNVTGVGFAHHLTKSFFVSNPEFSFDLTFKNEAGKVKKRTFKMNYSTIGLKNELLYRTSFMFVTDNELNLLSANTKVELGRGFEIGCALPYSGPRWTAPAEIVTFSGKNFLIPEHGKERPLVTAGITVLPFKNIKGSIIIVHAGAGLTGILGTLAGISQDIFASSLHRANLAMVRDGGSLTPA